MRDVSIIGIGQTKVSEHWDKSLRQLATEAISAALSDPAVSGTNCEIETKEPLDNASQLGYSGSRINQ